MKRITILFIVLIFFILGIVIWWKHGLTPANNKDTSSKIFLVTKGQSIREIASNLKKERLITDPTVFYLLVKQLGFESKIQAGDFRLSPSMSAKKLAEELTHGTLDIWVTIPEGKRADEIADMLKEKIPTYDESWREALQKEEGYLFPDTYLIPRDATSELVIPILKNNFESKYTTLTAKANRSKQEIVIIASLIEREAKHAQDRPLVASVIYNRLEIDMALQIDATVQYLLGYQPAEKTWWKRHLTINDLAIDSPYNTYKNPGLPPGPIANPGISALEAAANPTTSDYLFYITDKNGVNRYAKTNAEHNANIQKYGL